MSRACSTNGGDEEFIYDVGGKARRKETTGKTLTVLSSPSLFLLYFLLDIFLLARGFGCVGLPYRWAPLYLHLHVYPDARYE
jgi:hypothetical protein